MSECEDSPTATPVPDVMTVAEFFSRFGSDAACREHLKAARWGEKLERFEWR